MTRTLLKVLVEARHLRDPALFNMEYDRAAAAIDRRLVGGGPSHEQLERWLAGRVKTKPRAHHCLVLERLFPGHTVAELLSAYQPPDNPDGTTSRDVEPAPDRRGRTKENATNRREIFALGGATAAGLMFTRLLDEPDHMHATLDSGSVSEQRLTDLEETADRLGLQVVLVPSAPLLDEASSAFRSIRTLLGHRQRTADQVRLVRTAAKLATVVGDILFNNGELGLAGQWYKTARSAALDVGDQYLADIALDGYAHLPTYFGSPHQVLSLVDPRLEGKTAAPTPAIAWLWAFKAKAHAALGEDIAFRHAINRSRQVLDASPAELKQPGIFSFLPEKLAFYEANGCARLRDVEGAVAAADRALRTDRNLALTTEPALVRLEKASAFTQTGDLNEACRLATIAVLDKDTYPTSTVRRRAAEFDEQLGLHSTPSIREWRDALHTIRSRRPALTT